MTAITFPYPPGFADVPDSSLAAESFAQGILLGAIAQNAAMGMVRPEVFVGTYKHGDTVPLPVSPVDGYPYSRSELNYMWGITNLEDPSTGQGSVNDRYAFGQWFIDQNTGQVTIEKYYSNDEGSHQEKTNDGQLYVYTFGQRDMGSLIISSGPPFYNQHSDGDYGVDAPLRETPLRDLNRNAKFGIVANEAIYQGTYQSLQQIARPISPIDGYVYQTSEVIWIWSWVWNTKGDAFANPITYDHHLTQMDQMRAHIDADGTVHINIHFRTDDDLNMGDLFGRIAVMALCTRSTSGSTTNFTVPSKTRAWRCDAGLNAGTYYIDFWNTANWPPVRQPVSAGQSVRVQYVSGLIGIGNGEPSNADTRGVPVGSTFYGLANTPPWTLITNASTRAIACAGIIVFTDAAGTIIGTPLYMGLDTGVLTVPAGAAFLQVGLLDAQLGDETGAWTLSMTTNATAAPSTSGPFAWVDPDDMAAGEPARGDLMIQINRNAAIAALRPEFFNAGDFTNGQQVPLPVSPIDGYTYTRDEIIYLWEMGDTGLNLNKNIRVIDWKAQIYANGFVSIFMLHMRTGGYLRWDTEGTLRVKIIAMRSSVIATNIPTTPLLPGTTSHVPDGPGSSLDNFSITGQEVADGWTKIDTAGSYVLGEGASTTNTGSSQSIHVNAGTGNSAGVVSKRIPVYITDRYIATWKAKSDTVITAGWIIRVRLFSADQDSSVYFDIYSGGLDLVIVYPKPIWEVPVTNDTLVQTSFGDKAIVGTLDFDPMWASIEALVFEPDSACTVLVSDVALIKTELKLDDVTIEDDGYGLVSAVAGLGGGGTVASGYTEPVCFNGEIVFLNGDVVMIGVNYQ